MDKVVLQKHGERVLVRGKSYQLDINAKTGISRLFTSQKNFLFQFPLNIRIEQEKRIIQMPPPFDIRLDGNSMTVFTIKSSTPFARQELFFDFESDAFTCRYKATVTRGQKVTPIRVEYFRDAELGMRLNAVKEGFCVPSAPLSEEDYRNIFPSVSLKGLSSPPVLNIGLKFHAGFVALGLLDLSNATVFGVSFPWMGLAVDAWGGNVTFSGGEEYVGPRVLFTFPREGEQSITVFRNYLDKKGLLTPKRPEEQPQWWKRPTYCTYGDQIMAMQPALYTDAYWDSSSYTQDWVKRTVIGAEDRLGYSEFTTIIDAFWQKRWDPDPVGDPRRFGRMRQLVDWLHDRGHKVLLWYSPHIVLDKGGVGRLARKFKMLSQYQTPEGWIFLDYSNPSASNYVHEIARRLFHDSPDCLNADGVKLDFVSAILPTEQRIPCHEPGSGMGFRMVHRYLKLFYPAAKSFKLDALINYSAGDPRFAHLFDMNRLHDIKITPLERERRAWISALANPDLLIDSDGAVMMSDWVEHTYLSAAVYSTPSLYYTDVFNDGQRLPGKMMKTLGKLFKMCAHRCWGRPEFISYGNWRLRGQDGNVIGESYQGKLCWLQTGADTINIICFNSQTIPIDLHGIKIKSIHPLPGNLQIKEDKIHALWKGGILYKLIINRNVGNQEETGR
ncbi:MAG: hypothetical protein WC975_09300 [Phycisphaerae bacterium]